MGDVIAFHPPKLAEGMTYLYEVTDVKGEAIWAGNSAMEAVSWLRNATGSSRMLVSVWDTTIDDAWMIGQPIDITPVLKALLNEYWGE